MRPRIGGRPLRRDSTETLYQCEHRGSFARPCVTVAPPLRRDSRPHLRTAGHVRRRIVCDGFGGGDAAITRGALGVETDAQSVSTCIAGFNHDAKTPMGDSACDGDAAMMRL